LFLSPFLFAGSPDIFRIDHHICFRPSRPCDGARSAPVARTQPPQADHLHRSKRDMWSPVQTDQSLLQRTL
jgi:hypothetical protein